MYFWAIIFQLQSTFILGYQLPRQSVYTVKYSSHLGDIPPLSAGNSPSCQGELRISLNHFDHIGWIMIQENYALRLRACLYGGELLSNANSEIPAIIKTYRNPRWLFTFKNTTWCTREYAMRGYLLHQVGWHRGDSMNVMPLWYKPSFLIGDMI
jgi:hypothetical protein